MKQITVGSRQFELHWFTGKVVSVTKNLETRVHGGGGGGQVGGYSAPVSVSSTTTVHDQLFLTDKDGVERAFQLQDFNVACRETNQVTVLWAMKAGQNTGQYVIVYNHTTQEVRFDDSSIKKLVAPSSLGCLGVVCAALVLPILIFFGGFILTFVGGVLAVGTDFSALAFGMPVLVILFAFVTFVVAIAGPLGWYMWTTSKRVRQFKAAFNVRELTSA